MNQDRLHRQVRALLAIAEDPAASPAERDTAMRRATTLMARHSITTLDPTTATTEEITTRTITIPGGTSTPAPGPDPWPPPPLTLIDHHDPRSLHRPAESARPRGRPHRQAPRAYRRPDNHDPARGGGLPGAS